MVSSINFSSSQFSYDYTGKFVIFIICPENFQVKVSVDVFID